ncbi:glycosyltransferase [Microbacterium sp. ARD31]|uniref:glycosyltransferase n=1 Tax=Microbacterium sp. ARD31 TaxID=2962576 RepID=UPI0028812ADF|nr:glycosyltransferase [Microbacterium sp. ARD31]MDT0183058.1 glycosyltransferase [Microbacterium sp. ARD31]
MTRMPVRTVIVVVPAHDEELLLGRCLTALDRAVVRADARGVRCVVRVVLDDCSDGSALVAARHRAPVVSVAHAAVGYARAAGIADALEAVEDARGVWIANTDADSAVPENWITAQLDAAAAGADVYLGTVRPDFAELPAVYERHWRATHVRGRPAGHVHGASLGIRAEVYDAVGGFGGLREHEDVDLVTRARAAGARVVASDVAEVLTSGRFVGRTPGGYAEFVRRQAAVLMSGASVLSPAVR